MTGSEGFHGIYPMLYAFFRADGELRAGCQGRIPALDTVDAQVHDRPPALAPSAFGLELVARWSRDLPPLATGRP